MCQLIFDSPWQLVATCLVWLVAKTVYVLFGFGANLLAVGALALVLPSLHDVVVMTLLVNIPAEILVVAKAYKKILWRSVAFIAVGLVVGVPLGALVLTLGKPTFLLSVLAVLLILAGAVFLLPRNKKIAWPPWAAPIVGLISGVLSGIFGTGGPPVVLYYQLGGTAKAAFRGSLMAIFLIVAIIRLPSYALGDLITLPRVLSSLAVMPAVLLGAYLGNRIHIELSQRTFEKLVCVALIAMGLVLLLRTQL